MASVGSERGPFTVVLHSDQRVSGTASNYIANIRPFPTMNGRVPKYFRLTLVNVAVQYIDGRYGIVNFNCGAMTLTLQGLSQPLSSLIQPALPSYTTFNKVAPDCGTFVIPLDAVQRIDFNGLPRIPVIVAITLESLQLNVVWRTDTFVDPLTLVSGAISPHYITLSFDPVWE